MVINLAKYTVKITSLTNFYKKIKNGLAKSQFMHL